MSRSATTTSLPKPMSLLQVLKTVAIVRNFCTVRQEYAMVCRNTTAVHGM